jgi:integrase
MARAKASPLGIKKKRFELPVSKKPRFESLGDGVSLGYRRNQGAGTWVARRADGKGGSSQRVIGLADDFQEADGELVLSWAQAQAKAFATTAAGEEGSGKSLTLRTAIERYEADLTLRGGDPGNVARLKLHVPAALQDKAVRDFKSGELRAWRDELRQKLRPATVNRTATALKAALNFTADQHEGITSRDAWEKGLSALPDASVARNVILSDEVVQKIVRSAYQINDSFGLLVEVASVTGARYSQMAGLRVRDLQDDNGSPRLMMPSAKKGKGTKKVSYRPVPISPSLASRLRHSARSRPQDESLLIKATGEPWRRSDHTRLFARAIKRSGIESAAIAPLSFEELTIYALRHSNIARQILKGVPIRVVAVVHDTSVAMIEKNYSAYLADHADAIARSAMLDTGPAPEKMPVVSSLR